MPKPIFKKAAYMTASMVALLAMSTFFTPTAQAAQFTMSTKNLYFNGNLVSSPEGFASLDGAGNDNTTYIPIWYIQQLLKNSFAITQTWDGHNWQLSVPSTLPLAPFTQVQPSPDSDKRVVWLNNQAFESPAAIITIDPTTGNPTTYFPLWYIEQVLHLIGVQDTWDGTNWALNMSTSSNLPSSGNGVAGTTAGVLHDSLQNAAQDDTSWWARANGDYYISAQTADPAQYANPISGSKIVNVAPGQKLYLFAYSQKGNVTPSQTTWNVNSPDATVTANSSGWTRDNYDITEGDFTANQPGIYTVQANVNGAYSVPLVITVGLNQLKYRDIRTTPDVQGIKPLPLGLQVQAMETDGAGTNYTLYTRHGNWVPLAGTTTIGTKFVTVAFGNSAINPAWSYSLPVADDGTFSAEVKCPVAGQTDMYLFTNYIGDLTSTGNGQDYLDSPLDVPLQLPNDAINISQSVLDLMPSAKMDYNLNPAFAQLAATLYENAPSADSGIEAINNYVSDVLTYDSSELQPNGYRFQDVNLTWNSQTGICEDYAEVEAAMFKSIGIRSETVSGSVSSATSGNDPTTSSSGDNHEWLQAWDGAKWVVADPTWSSDDATNTALVTNEFFTNTSSMQSTHITDASSIGNTFSKVRQHGGLASINFTGGMRFTPLEWTSCQQGGLDGCGYQPGREEWRTWHVDW